MCSALIVLLAVGASASRSEDADFEVALESSPSLVQLTLSLGPKISSDLGVKADPAGGSPFGTSPDTQSCHTIYNFAAMLAGMLVITILFFGLGLCARIATRNGNGNAKENKRATGPPQMLAGEAHLADVQPPMEVQPPTAKGPSRPAHVGAIDGLRAIFALWVVVWHLAMYIYKSEVGFRLFADYYSARPLMQFFFVASGFVNVRSTQRDSFDWQSGFVFIQRRIARLFPMLWCSMWLLEVFFLLKDSELCHAPAALAEAMGYTSVQNKGSWAINGTTWFVSALFLLNVLFPMLYNMSPSRPATTSCLILLMVVYRSSYLICPSFTNTYFMLYTCPLSRFSEFFAGMLSAAWCRQMQSHVGSWSGWGCIFDALMVLAVVLIPIGCKLAPHVAGDFGLTAPFCLICISASMAVDAPLHGSPTNRFWPQLGLWGLILNCGPLQFMAKYAWTIYVLQIPVLETCRWLLPKYYFDHFVALPVIILLGIVADVALDQPIQRILDRYMRGAQA